MVENSKDFNKLYNWKRHNKLIEFIVDKNKIKNEKNSIKKENISNKFNKLLISIFILISFSTCLSRKINLRALICSYEIIIKINGSGEQSILSQNSEEPDELYLNGNPVNPNKIINILNNDINTIKIIWNSPISTCNSMFFYLINIVEIDLSNFDSSLVTDMKYMFSGCSSLTSINLSNINTSSVADLSYVFNGCSSLKSLDLSSFNTSNVKNIDNMFNDCKLLEKLDIRNFDTASVLTMNNMFTNCHSLKSLDLTNFITSKVNNMIMMFYNCYSLTSLELGNFDISSVTDLSYMFHGCKSLVSLNLYSFISNNKSYKDELFINLNDSFKYCINDEIDDSIKTQLSKYTKLNCSELCFINSQSKYIPEKNKCIKNCTLDDSFYIENNNICLSSCQNGAYLLNNYENIECLNYIPLGYYLSDTNKRILDKCNIKCSNCTNESVLNDLCISCNIGLGYYPKFNDYFSQNGFVNCYNGEQTGYYLDYENNIFQRCSSECKVCDGKGNIDNNLCIECYDNYTLFNGNCYLNLDDNSIVEESKIFNESYYSYLLNSNLTLLKNTFANISFIDFFLKEKDIIYSSFNLDKELDNVYVSIIEYISNDSKMVTKDFSYKLFLENKTELNLKDINKDFIIDVYLPIKDLYSSNFHYYKYFLNQEYDIYNKSSVFYHKFCSPAYYEENDIIIRDRKKYIYPNNVILCKENFNYKGVDLLNNRIICSCNLSQNNNSKETINEEDFLIEDKGNFLLYLLDNINYKIFTCYELLLSFDNLKNNYAFYLMLADFITILILNLFYRYYSISKLKIKMIEEIPTKKKVKNEIIRELRKFRKNTTKNRIKVLKNNKNNNKVKKTIFKKKKIGQTKKLYSNSPSIEVLPLSNEKLGKIYKVKDISKENEEEDINDLPYSKALIRDKRNSLKIFISILIKKIDIISLFYEDEKLKIMSASEYILSLLIDFFINALLYSDEIVSHKYHNNGTLDFFVILVVTLLSNFITFLICYYINYTDGIDDRYDLIMEINIKKKYLENINRFLRKIKLKYMLFFIFQILLISFCYYYIVIFCIVYSRSKGSLLINYLYSLFESFITSIAISIIILATRKIGLLFHKKLIYNISKYIYDQF